MFYVHAPNFVAVYKSESFDQAKHEAIRRKDATSLNYTITEVKQVWTTQTLDEAVKG